MGPKALYDVLRISSCFLQSDVKEESLDENYIVIVTGKPSNYPPRGLRSSGYGSRKDV